MKTPKISYTNRKIIEGDFATVSEGKAVKAIVPPKSVPKKIKPVPSVDVPVETVHQFPEQLTVTTKTRKVRTDKGKKRSTYSFSKELPPKYVSYIKRAIAKSLKFDLTVEEFFSLLENPCEYCGDTESLTVDRVDSSKGYTKDNVVPCCYHCNIMKGMFSTSKFLKHVEDIYRFQNSRGEDY